MTADITAQRQAVVQEARSWLGTPYHPRARLKKIGVDCAQLLVAVYTAVGVVDSVQLGTYAIDWHLHRSDELYLERVRAHCVPVTTPEPGDIAVFQFGRCVSHGAIVVEGSTIIHAYRGLGVVLDEVGPHRALEHRLRGYWSPVAWAREHS